MKTTAELIQAKAFREGRTQGQSEGKTAMLAHFKELYSHGNSFERAMGIAEDGVERLRVNSTSAPAGTSAGRAPVQSGGASQEPDMGDAVVALMLAERGEVTA